MSAQEVLDLRRPRVVERTPSTLSRADQDANLAACPRYLRETLRVIYRHASRSGRLFAGVDRLAGEVGVQRRAFQYQRAALIAAGFLVAQGGGHRGRTACYVLMAPDERAAAVEALHAAQGCPWCGADHRPAECGSRPIAPRLPGLELSTTPRVDQTDSGERVQRIASFPVVKGCNGLHPELLAEPPDVVRGVLSTNARRARDPADDDVPP
jgi:hypothetical protein